MDNPNIPYIAQLTLYKCNMEIIEESSAAGLRACYRLMGNLKDLRECLAGIIPQDDVIKKN